MIMFEFQQQPGFVIDDHGVYMSCEYCETEMLFFTRPQLVCPECGSKVFPNAMLLRHHVEARIEFHNYEGVGNMPFYTEDWMSPFDIDKRDLL